MTLNADIQKILGVVPATPVPPYRPLSHSVPPRPEALYEYSVEVYRSEYGSVTVRAANSHEARDCAWGEDVHWYDCGDTEIASVDKNDNDPCNQDELDEWDEQYANKYTVDGDPKCSNCGDEYNDDELIEQDANTWYCSECCATLSAET